MRASSLDTVVFVDVDIHCLRNESTPRASAGVNLHVVLKVPTSIRWTSVALQVPRLFSARWTAVLFNSLGVCAAALGTKRFGWGE